MAVARKAAVRSKKETVKNRTSRPATRSEPTIVDGTGTTFSLRNVTDMLVISLTTSIERRKDLDAHIKSLQGRRLVNSNVRVTYVDAKTAQYIKNERVTLGSVLIGGLDTRRAAAACTLSHSIACAAAAKMLATSLSRGVLILEDSARFEYPEQTFHLPLGRAVSVGHAAPKPNGSNRTNYKKVLITNEPDGVLTHEGQLLKRKKKTCGNTASAKGYVVTSANQARTLEKAFRSKVGRDYADAVLLKNPCVLICDPPMVGRSDSATTIG